jgi:excisionase family DNA binding protein
MQPGDSDTLTTQEAALLMGVDDSRVRSLRIQGKLSGIQRGGTWFFKRADVEALNQIRRRRKKKQALESEA